MTKKVMITTGRHSFVGEIHIKSKRVPYTGEYYRWVIVGMGKSDPTIMGETWHRHRAQAEALAEQYGTLIVEGE